MANELGLRSLVFEVDDLQAAVDGLAADGYGLVGGLRQHENIWRMSYVRGPEGIISRWPSGSADTRTIAPRNLSRSAATRVVDTSELGIPW